ncbi:MAG TPA: LptF/LptG family permease [Bryobacteraceae bacterium]|jgi:LPS export ABC transporter permease LptG/LPS export ABC transporter permease LptF|nr:LptF/LptG family permease [Bryobacteraceae bacterium]
MGILGRAIFREVINSTLLGTVMFTFVLFLQRLGRLFEILVRTSASPSAVLHLFLLAVPATFAFTIPLGVLVGTLIALSRMASDGEITAMRASGVPSRKVIFPVLLLAVAGLLVTAASTLWLTPYSLWKTNRIVNELVASELTADVQPHIFEEQFPDTVLYVGDVTLAAETPKGPVYRWKKIFMADLKPPAQRNNDGHERGDAPRITVASDALAIPDIARNRIQLSMKNSTTHEVGKDSSQYYSTSLTVGDSLLEAQRPNEVHVAKAVEELDTVPLYRMAYKSKAVEKDKVIEARIELNKRFSLPLACVILALLGIPLGVSSRKGGKSTAFVVTVALAFLYYMGLITMIGFAKQQRLPAGVALWIPDSIFFLFAMILMVRLETPGDRDIIGMIRAWLRTMGTKLRVPTAPVKPRRRIGIRLPLVPQLLDTYVLSTFVFYFAVLLSSFVLMTEVFTFFELLSDIIKNHIAMSEVLEYLFFLAPQLIDDSVPLSVLVAVLITFGVLTKNNEVTAFKSCGVSVFRLAMPVLVLSLLLSGGLFAFDHYIVPDANRRQDALRNKIKGRPVQSYFRADRKWILGESTQVYRFYYYKYFDQMGKAMAGVNVYELDPNTFRLERWISAERARWEPHIHKWIFENGWSRSFDKGGEHLTDFTGKVMTFPEITETSDYFLKEEIESKQMNFLQLSNYIRELQQSGFDTVPLQVQFYRKFSVPLFALIMALISIPFAFLAGNRGAMTGVGISFCIAIAYLSLNMLFQEVGKVSLLPAAVAAWSPDLLFTLSGLYLFTKMRS